MQSRAAQAAIDEQVFLPRSAPGVQLSNLFPGRVKKTGIFAVSGLRGAGQSAPPHV